MNPLKFRAWDGQTMCKVERLGWSEDSDNPVWFEAVGGTWNQVDDQIKLMQYTGLKDRTGVEIYDGDIVRKSNGMYFKIQWQTSPFRTGWTINTALKCEVVGNIYENKELLK